MSTFRVRLEDGKYYPHLLNIEDVIVVLEDGEELKFKTKDLGMFRYMAESGKFEYQLLSDQNKYPMVRGVVEIKLINHDRKIFYPNMTCHGTNMKDMLSQIEKASQKEAERKTWQ